MSSVAAVIIVANDGVTPDGQLHLSVHTLSKDDAKVWLFDKNNQKTTMEATKNEALNVYLDLRSKIEKRLKAIANSQEKQKFQVPYDLINQL